MRNEKVNIQSNGMEHAPTCLGPAMWPVPWLTDLAVAPCPASPVPVPVVTVAVPEGADDCDTIDPPAPCPKCGSLELWQDLLGGWHCQRCDVAAWRRSRRLLDRAVRSRQQVDTR